MGAYIQVFGLVPAGLIGELFGSSELALIAYSATIIILNQHQQL